MTLLTTEIHQTPAGEVVVFAADRLIVRGTEAVDSRKKIFKVPGRRLGVGYVGLAEVMVGGGPQPMAEWLQDMFSTMNGNETTADFAHMLTRELNQVVPVEWRATMKSGLHVAGVSEQGEAEFWFVRNIDDDARIFSHCYTAREDYRGRDRQRLAPGEVQIYRNGDVQAHVAAWTQLDQSLGVLLETPSFRSLKSTDDYELWVRFKMETIATFYQRFSTEPIVGPPVDCFVLAN